MERVKEEADKLFERARTARDGSPLPDEPDARMTEEMVMNMARWAISRISDEEMIF